MIDDRDVSLNRSIKMWDNIPLDERAITESLNELDDYINYPYIGMIFYSNFEDDYYKVLSLEDGYRIRTGEIKRAKDIDIPNSYPLIKGYFIGSYEQYTLKGNSKTMIKKAYIDKDGFLHIVFYDDKDTNVGYVKGDPGYCPQIKENEFNDITTLKDLIYKLDITYCDEITHLKKTITTENLIGPYVVDISDEVNEEGIKTGYTIFTLNTNDQYKIGPYGIKTCYLESSNNGMKKNLIIKFNDGTIKDLGNVRGENGTSVNIIGTLNSEEDLPSYAKNGDAYIIGKDLYFYFNKWKNVGQIVGNDGETPDIDLRYSVIKATSSDEDKRDTLKLQFFNGNKLIGESIKIKLPYSPDITAVGNDTDTVYKLIIHGVKNNGEEFIINTPNLKGKDGTSIKIKNSINDYTELTKYSENSEIGDSYIVDNPNIDNDGHLWTYSGDKSITDEKHYEGFVDVGKIKGPKGDTGDTGSDGKSLEFNWDGTKLGVRVKGQSKYVYSNLQGPAGNSGADGKNIEIISNRKDETTGITTIIFSDGNVIEIKDGINGKNGRDGKDGISINKIEFTSSDKGNKPNITGATDTYTITYTNNTTSTFTVYNGKDGQNGINGKDGKSLEFNWNGTRLGVRKEGDTNFVYTNLQGDKGDKGDNGESVTITSIVKLNGITTVVFSDGNHIEINDGLIGNDGKSLEFNWDGTRLGVRKEGDTEYIYTDLKGNDGIDGTDGREIELKTTDTMIQWRYIDEENWTDLISIETITGPKGDKGDTGLDAEVSITENPDNDDLTYKLDISYTSKGEEVSFTTPNLKGGINELYKILESLPEKDINNELDYNHIYMILKEDVTEVISKEANYDKYIILNISEDKTITWEKIETTEASGNILVICEELPNIDTASTNFIYCLLTPEYQRGLNIGLTNGSNSNKNFYEEWIVIETETEKKWELLGPQIYRISASMIDYIWKFSDKFTVYDDWDTASDIPEYQKKHYGDATPLNNFIFRLVPSGSTYNLILVKEVSGGKINKLSIAPQYKVTLNGTTYTCTVTELDGTYDDSYTYYESDDKGNASIKTYSSEEEFGTQSVFSGVEVYGVYVADTVKKITRGFLYTSNMSAYHIPYDLEIIGDYAFYSTKSPTVQFEKLINNGKDVEAYPLAESKVKAIGVHAFDGNSNLAFLIRNDDGTTKDSNIVKTPATLKKIGDYAFYNTRIATLDTNLSSNLYIGDHAFVQCVHGGQTLSPTTYYTDSVFLGVDGLTHDTINYSNAGVSNWFEGIEHAGHNFNFDSEHENDVLHVTLTSVDPDWSL